MLCCLALATIPFVVLLAYLSTNGFTEGHTQGMHLGYKKGYIQALQDIKKGNHPAYVLVEQPDGTTKWESNKEKGK
jgi:hypothetical protein